MTENITRRRENEVKRLKEFMIEFRRLKVAPLRMSKPEVASALGYNEPRSVDRILNGLPCIRDGKTSKYLIEDIASAIVQEEMKGAS